MRLWFWLCLIVGVVGSQVCLWSTKLPLGIPGEWTWRRVESEPDILWNLIGVMVAVVLYVAFVEAGARRLSRLANLKSRFPKVCAWLAGLVAVSFVWLWVVQETAPTGNRLGKSAFVLYYSSSSGYFTKARYEDPDAGVFLSGYEDLMRERDVLHVGTHPPGLFLIFHGLIGACQNSSLSSFLDVTQPASFREACDVIAWNSVRLNPPRPLLAADRRVLWLATLLVMATASLAVIPLYGLMLRTHDSTMAWWTAALWPAIPAVAVFTPKSDVAYAFVGLLMTWAWLTAVDRRSILLAFVAGLLVWCGLMMSLAFLPVILFMAIAGSRPVASTESTSETSDRTSNRLKLWLAVVPPARCVAAGVVGFLIPTLLLGWYCRVNLFAVWLLNYQNHAAFYAQYPRTYWRWLLVNPIELAVAVGWPVMLLATGFLWDTVRTRRLFTTHVALGVVIVWGILWLTGKNSGETARLWIVFLPWLVWLAGLSLAELNLYGTRRWFRPSMFVLAVQLVICALTVARVSGFDP